MIERKKNYSNISNTRAEMRDLPPVGYATSLLQTKQGTTVAALPKMTCSFLHLEQRTLINRLLGIDGLILYELHTF